MKGGLQYNETKFVDAKVKKLGELITSVSLHIPHHQRDFSWEKGELDNFLSDIENLMKQDFEDENSLPHFFGSFVFIPNSELNSYEVIDGQQRITTTMMYHLALKFLTYEEFKKEEKSKSMEKFHILLARINFFLSRNPLGQAFEPRLKLGRGDDFFNELLEKNSFDEAEKLFNDFPQKRDVHVRIFHALEYLYQELKKNISKEKEGSKFDIILKYIEAVQTMFVVIEILVQEPGVAYTVFETLNARGKTLAPANLIKNNLLMKAEQQGTNDKVLKIWSNIVEELTQYENADITDFILNSYYSRFGSKSDRTNQKNLFNSIKNLLDKKGISALDFASYLEKDCEPYKKLRGYDRSTDKKFTKETIKYIEELNVLNISRVYPLLLTGYEVLEPKDFQKLVILTVNFAFRYKVVLNESADALLRIIMDLSCELRKGSITLDNIKERFLSEASDTDFEIEFQRFTPRSAKLAFYTLKKIEDHLSKRQGITVLEHSPNQHLEHIMPKCPKESDWPHLFKSGKLDDRHNSYLNRIGNLTILEADINRFIRNKSFEFKNSNEEKKDYQNSSLKLPKNIQKYLTKTSSKSVWDFRSIEERSKYLAKLAVKVWSLNIP